MFSTTLQRTTSVSVVQKLGPSSSILTHRGSKTKTASAISASSTPSYAHQRRTYRSDNSVYGFKEKDVESVQDAVPPIQFAKLQHLVDAYRSHGHLEAATNPLKGGEAGTVSAVRRMLQTRALEVGEEEVQSQNVIGGQEFSTLQVLSIVNRHLDGRKRQMLCRSPF